MQIEAAHAVDDHETELALIQQLPQEQQALFRQNENPVNLENIQQPSAPLIGINGAACAYYDIPTAISNASDGDTIYISYGTYSGRIGVISFDLTLTSATPDCLSVDSIHPTTVDGNATYVTYGGVVEIATGVQVTFTNMVLTNGYANYGGIVYARTGVHLILDNTELISGTATTRGGGLRISSSTTYVEMLGWSDILSSTTKGSGGDGGGVAIQNGTLVMHDSSRVGYYHSGNKSADLGGGVYMYGGLLQMYENSRIRTNFATSNGGGVYAEYGADVEIYDDAYIGGTTTTSANEGFDGGGIYLTGSSTSLSIDDHCGVKYNYAGNYGGGIFVAGGATVNIDGGLVNDNEADERGGGIYVDGESFVELKNKANLNYNLTSGVTDAYGGGMYIYGTGAVVSITASFVLSNVSDIDYGGIRLRGDSLLTIENSQLTHNKANSGDGGALSISGTVNMKNVIIQYNTALYHGGGIDLRHGILNFDDPDIRFNQARDGGGGIYRTGGDIVLRALSRLSYLGVNTTTQLNGGGIYDSSGDVLSIDAVDGYQFALNTNTAQGNGGGIFATNGTIVDLEGDVQMTSNLAVGHGGAIYIEDGSLAYVNDMQVDDTLYIPKILVNEAGTGNGGGIYAVDLQVQLYGAQFGFSGDGNEAVVGDGGGVYLDNSSLTMQNCLFSKNEAGSDGGGIAAINSSTVIVDSAFPPDPGDPWWSKCDPFDLAANHYCSEFRENAATGFGGAIYANNSTMSIEHTAFFSNTSAVGSAFSSQYGLANLYDSLFVGNNATSPNNATSHVYAGIAPGTPSTLNAMNNTWADNDDLAVLFDSFTNGNFNNNIVWGNDGKGTITPLATAACNDTQQMALPGPGNISTDPQFITTIRGAYRLGASSPAVDQCSSGSTPDLDNHPRPRGANFDMGAFEMYWPLIYLPVVLN